MNSKIQDDRYLDCIASCVRHDDGTYWDGDVRCTHPVLFADKEASEVIPDTGTAGLSSRWEVKDIPLDPNVQLQFDKNGYVLLWASVLQDYVAYYNTEDDLKKVPEGFIPYHYDELVQISNNNLTDQELQTIHMAKRVASGRITSIKPKDKQGTLDFVTDVTAKPPVSKGRRPRYEQPADVGNEKVALDLFVKSLNDKAGKDIYSWKPDEVRDRFDAALYLNGEKRYSIEVKTRKPEDKHYAVEDGYMVSKRKWMKLRTSDARFLVYYRGKEVYFTYPSETSGVTFKMGKRAEMRDSYDKELMAYIPWDNFRLIGECS